MFERPTAAPPPTSRLAPLAFWLPGFLAMALVIAAFIHRGGLSGHSQAQSYYEYLTDALLSGQLHLKIEPDPRLAELENPWLGYQGIERLHDASYFEGKYYLYFGASPVVALLGPWRLLFGVFMPDEAATAAFAAIALLAGLTLLRRLQKQAAPELSPPWLALLSLTWSASSYLLFVLHGAAFYAIPILAGSAFILLALNFLFNALERPSVGAASWWLAASSLSWGFAISARPNLLFGLVSLALAALFLVRKRTEWPARAGARIAAATLLPAALVGGAMVWYNYARFGHPLEFGWHYQFAAEDLRQLAPLRPGAFSQNLSHYLFSEYSLSPYFPFVLTWSAIPGLLTFCPLLALAVAAPFLAFFSRLTFTVRVLIATAFLAGLAHLLGLSFFMGGADRYQVDNAPVLLLAAFVPLMLLVRPLSPLSGALRRVVLTLVVLLGLFSVVVHTGLNLARLPDGPLRQTLERSGVKPVAALEACLDVQDGETLLELEPGALVIGRLYPLVATHAGANAFYLKRTTEDLAVVGFIRRGNSPVEGRAFVLKPGTPLTIHVIAASLLSPSYHPRWDTLSAAENLFLQRLIRVTVEGEVVLQTSTDFGVGSPWDRQFGTIDPVHSNLEGAFLGSLRHRRAPLPPLDVLFRPQVQAGPLRFTLRFPPFTVVKRHPLVSTGNAQSGDLIYVTYLAPGTARIGHDNLAQGGSESPVFTFPPEEPVTLDVNFAPLTHPSQAGSAPLAVTVNGTSLLYRLRPYSPSLPFEVEVGVNGIRSSSAEGRSEIALLEVAPSSLSDAPPRGSTLDTQSSHGAAQFLLQFPDAPLTRAEPLLVSGRQGRGDLVYLIPDGPHHVRIGHDHWSVGAAVSSSLPVPSSKELDITIISPLTTRGLTEGIPAELHAYCREGLVVLVGGQVILASPYTPYPDPEGQLDLGRNDIGGSSCSAYFQGHLRDPRLGPVAPPRDSAAP